MHRWAALSWKSSGALPPRRSRHPGQAPENRCPPYFSLFDRLRARLCFRCSLQNCMYLGVSWRTTPCRLHPGAETLYSVLPLPYCRLATPAQWQTFFGPEGVDNLFQYVCGLPLRKPHSDSAFQRCTRCSNRQVTATTIQQQSFRRIFICVSVSECTSCPSDSCVASGHA